jgi:hypothetical protein
MFGFGSPNGNATSAMNVSTKAVTVTATSGAWSGATGKATLISGSIYRLEITATAAQTLGGSRLYCAAAANSQYVEVAGIQIEAGAYPTSFISKSTTASVTRVADAASKTGISSLIGQTEGTLYAEFTYRGVANSGSYEHIIVVSDGTTNNMIAVLKNNTTAELYVYAANGGAIQVNSVGISGTNVLGTHKVAFAYKANDYVCYLDGVQVFTDTSATVPTVANVYVGTDGTAPIGGTINQALLFKTRLTNAQLAELTAL